MQRRSQNRVESDREDLLAEATALAERIEMTIDGFAGPIVAGFRANGAASFFFDQDPAWHFNPAGEFRRGYCDGKLYKAENGNVVTLTRHRTESAVNLVRHQLEPAEQQNFLNRIASDLTRLRDAMRSGKFQVTGQVPENAPIAQKVIAWLENVATIAVATKPHAGA